MLVLGAILGCIANGTLSLENVVCGGVSGLASTGMHQLFKQLIEGGVVATVLTDEEVKDFAEDDDDDLG